MTKNILYPMCKKQGLPNTQFRFNVNSELCIRYPLLLYVWGPFVLFENMSFQKYDIKVEWLIY